MALDLNNYPAVVNFALDIFAVWLSLSIKAKQFKIHSNFPRVSFGVVISWENSNIIEKMINIILNNDFKMILHNLACYRNDCFLKLMQFLTICFSLSHFDFSEILSLRP